MKKLLALALAVVVLLCCLVGCCKKNKLVESKNPEWKDLYQNLL